MDLIRTPDERFASLPDFPWSPRFVDVPSGEGDAIRVAYVEAGPADAPVVWMLHGEPSWSFLYRKVIAVVAGAGLRAIATDLVGFGRSDKPARREDYTYRRHVGWMRAFAVAIALRDATLLCQDWGGLIGLRLVAEMPSDTFARVVAANTILPTGDRDPGPAFTAWQQYSQSIPVFPAGKIVQRTCARPIDDAVVAAYDAPFPDETYKAGARQFPLLVPTRPDDPASAENRAAWEALGRFEKPFLTVFGDSDPITAGADRILQKRIPGARGRPHATLARAGHFLQEDAGEELGRAVVDFVRATS